MDTTGTLKHYVFILSAQESGMRNVTFVSFGTLFSLCLDGCQTGNRRLQPHHPCSVTDLSQVSLQRVFKGKTMKSNVFKLMWSCIVLYVCFVFTKFLWVIFCKPGKGHVIPGRLWILSPRITLLF